MFNPSISGTSRHWLSSLGSLIKAFYKLQSYGSTPTQRHAAMASARVRRPFHLQGDQDDDSGVESAELLDEQGK